MNPKIISEEPISIYDLASEIRKIKKRDEEELNIRTKKVEEYLNSFTDLKAKEAKDLEKELTELNVPRLKEFHIKKLIDLLPVDADDIKMIFSGYPITISKDNLNKIVSAIKKYKKE